MKLYNAPLIVLNAGKFGSDAGGAKLREYHSSSSDLETTSVGL